MHFITMNGHISTLR